VFLPDETDADIDITHKFCALQFVTTMPLLMYDFFQFTMNWKKYFMDMQNVVDFSTIAMYVISSGYRELSYQGETNAVNTSVYIIAVFIAFAKLYKNLEVIDNFRHLSFALFKILQDLPAFGL
jgi:hypothetical protein